MPEQKKLPRASYTNIFTQGTFDFLRLWAGEAGELLRSRFSTNERSEQFSPDRQFLRSETIFLADRDAARDQSAEIRKFCEDIASRDFSLNRIFDAESVSDLEEMFLEVSALQTVHHNQSISLDYRVDVDFEGQEASARIHLIKFFIIKRISAILNGKNITIDELHKSIVDHKEIRLKHLELEISNLLREAFAICHDDQTEIRSFQERIVGRTLQAEEAVALPTEAPELFTERTDKSITAEQFIRTVYGPWLGRGLKRPHIKELDKSLYQALYKQGIPDDFKELLPTAQGKSGKPQSILSALEQQKKRQAAARAYARKRDQELKR